MGHTDGHQYCEDGLIMVLFIRDELIQSRAREQLLDLMLAQEADHISNITNSFKQTQQLLDERYRYLCAFHCCATHVFLYALGLFLVHCKIFFSITLL